MAESFVLSLPGLFRIASQDIRDIVQIPQLLNPTSDIDWEDTGIKEWNERFFLLTPEQQVEILTALGSVSYWVGQNPGTEDKLSLTTSVEMLRTNEMTKLQQQFPNATARSLYIVSRLFENPYHS